MPILPLTFPTCCDHILQRPQNRVKGILEKHAWRDGKKMKEKTKFKQKIKNRRMKRTREWKQSIAMPAFQGEGELKELRLRRKRVLLSYVLTVLFTCWMTWFALLCWSCFSRCPWFWERSSPRGSWSLEQIREIIFIRWNVALVHSNLSMCLHEMLFLT